MANGEETGGAAALQIDEISASQRADLATLFATYFTLGNIEGFGTRVLGEQAGIALLAAGKTKEALAPLVIDQLHAAGRFADAIVILKTEAARNADFMLRLNHVLAGFSLATFANQQAFVQAEDDPFLDNDFLELFPRVQRTVCAVGLGEAGNIRKLRGTGFLVGPDLVMTNFHVVEPYLRKVNDAPDGELFEEGETGDNIFCFFDYLAAPSPRVPPDKDWPHPSVVVRGAKKGWLVRTRASLPNDGYHPYPTKEQVATRFDYAIIKLEREIGLVPTRRSGGLPRGWLNVASNVDFTGKARIIVLQHPQGAQQLFDIGVYDRLDPSGTRVWYKVNTDFGSSGGAAVDKTGRLYALHNAQVRDENGKTGKVNQGIRIDTILSDLSLPPAWAPPPPPADADMAYWSLSDTIAQPQPVIGRQFFRQTVQKMMKPGGDRCLAVIGKKGTGRRFSTKLLKRIVGSNVPVVHFTPSDLRTLGPKDFMKVLKGELQLSGMENEIPEPDPSEPLARWLSFRLPEWLARKLNEAEAVTRSRYPCWIVIDAVVEPGERLMWKDGLGDLVSALSGGHDEGQPAVDLLQLRWLMLGAEIQTFPSTQRARIVDDLEVGLNNNYVEDFADCLSLAWRSLDSKKILDPDLLRRMGRREIKKADKQELRAHLAQCVTELITDDAE